MAVGRRRVLRGAGLCGVVVLVAAGPGAGGGWAVRPRIVVARGCARASPPPVRACVTGGCGAGRAAQVGCGAVI